MKRKIISTILAITGLIIIAFATLFFLGLFQAQEAGLLIESEPIAKVYINNVEVGNTPYEANMKPGEINIKVKPLQTDGVILDDYETKLNLVSGIRTIIKRSFKEDEHNSSGVVVSFEKVNSKDSFVTVVSIPDNAQVTIDGKAYGYTPLRVRIPAGDHSLLVSSDKYLEKQLPIRVYQGYKLTASVKLGKSEELVLSEVKVSTEESKLTEQIRINKTDTGFLRVRSGANIGFPEVTQVKPGEIYDVLENGENGSWYKIKVGEIEGWVSAEFVSVI